MFVPVGDSPNPENFTPWVNYGLIATNVVIFFFTYVSMANVAVTSADSIPTEAVEWLRAVVRSNPGFQPSQYDVFTYLNGYKPGAPEFSDLFAAMFLHAGWLHLLGNMLFLWVYGDNIEHRLGRIPYLLLYLLTGVIATISFALVNPGSMIPMIGASGAISGVLGMYFIMFPRNMVKVFAFIFPILFGVYPFNARLVLGFYIVVQNIFPALFAAGQGGGVAYGAHIGGFVAGLGVAMLAEQLSGSASLPRATFRPPPRRPGRAQPRRAQPQEVQWASEEEAFRSAVHRQDRAEAVRRLAGLSAPDVALKMPDEAIKVAQWLAEQDQLIQASELVRRVLRFHRASGIDQAEVYYTLGLIRLRQGQPTSAYQHLLDALDFNPKPQTEERIREGLSQINVFRRS